MNISEKTYQEMKKLIANYESNQPIDIKNTPYLLKLEIEYEKSYNPKYGDDRICECGHPYYRHFDTYENMSPVGCKYCECYDFKEFIEKDNNFSLFLNNVKNNIIPNRMGELRAGQALMIYIHDIWPSEYSRMLETDVDCFYDDNKIEQTLNHIKKVWENYPFKQ